MAIKIGSNFTFQGEQPNFERDRFATKAAMKAFPETSIDDGHLSYCAEDGNIYQFKSSNSVDTITGKWRVFKADIDLSAYATKDSVAVDLDKKVDIKGVGKSTGSAQLPVIKVITINIPVNYRFRTGFFGITLMCDNEQFTRALITINTLPEDYVIKVVESSIHPKSNENLYYLYDKINNKVELYQTLLRNDNLTAKVTDQDANSGFTWNLDLELVDALPEGAIKVYDVNYGNKNLFYATPKGAAGDPKFRAIDITDLPDLSDKYATKAKAFTTDIVSTAPGQFVAGPATTQGNLYLRKIDASDIPDLKSKYQPINGNGIQEGPRAVGLSVGYRAQIGYLKALISASDTTSQLSPDWYFATDGTLQNITTKIPKVVLDDAVSTTSTNGVENQAITKYVDGKVTTINSNITDLHSSLESTQTDFVDLRNKVNAMPKTVFITQAAYNALTTKDANTIYYING